MSRNEILPKGMYWFYDNINDKFYLIVDKECEYQNIIIDKKSFIN